MRCKAALLALGLCLSSPLVAQNVPPSTEALYVGMGVNGEVEVSPLPFAGARLLPSEHALWQHAPATVTARPQVGPPLTAAPNTNNPAINTAIQNAADRHGIDANLLHAVIKVESNYRHRALSKVGAAGLMQLMPATAKRFGVVDRFNIEQNISGGAAYLKWLSKRFSGDLDLMLAAYNAGEGAVQKHGNRIPPYKETRAYVSKVRAHYVAFGY